MPLTAIALMMEFTRADMAFLVPMTLAVAGSLAASQFLKRHQAKAQKPSQASRRQRSVVESGSAIKEEAPVHSE
jgi:H+/Cl- antiporter ClcA